MTDSLDLRRHNRLIAGVVIAVLILAGAAVLWLTVFRSPTEDEGGTTEVAVSVGRVQRMDIHTYVLGYGSVDTSPAEGGRSGGGANLAAPIAGIVFAIPVSEGQRVKAGTVIVRLDDRMTEAAVEKANQALRFAQQQFDRQKQLLAIGGTSQKVFQAAQQQLASANADVMSARGGLAQTQLTSPLDGVVARLNVSLGQTVDANTVVAQIVDLSRLIVTVNIPANEAATLQAGQIAYISRNESDASVARGTVVFVSPAVDSRTDTALVRIALPTNVTLRPGELVKTRIVTDTHAGVLAVPFDSVVKRDTQSAVHIVRNNTAVQVMVQLGPRDGDFVEVRSPAIHAGDVVVTTGAYGLPQQTKINISAR